jgi:hypothetical protein
MKKQILFLAFILLAAFANVNKSFGQCSDDALHPMAGKLYHYIITTSGGGADKSTQWVVTKNTAIVNASTFVTGIAPGATTFTWSGETTKDVSITWSPTLIADAMAGNRYYVAVKHTSTNSEGCDVDNVKVYTIDPVNMFQIDLANVKADGSALASGNVCTSPVITATVNGNTDVAYDFGTSTLYVKVTAKNFSGSWDMTVANTLLASLDLSETGTLTWVPTIGGTETAVTPGTAITIPEKTADPTDSEDIFLKLVVDHNKFEGLTAESFPFRVDGKDDAGNDDVSATCAADNDEVTQTILERPTITNGTAGGTYLPNQP